MENRYIHQNVLRVDRHYSYLDELWTICMLKNEQGDAQEVDTCQYGKGCNIVKRGHTWPHRHSDAQNQIHSVSHQINSAEYQTNYISAWKAKSSNCEENASKSYTNDAVIKPIVIGVHSDFSEQRRHSSDYNNSHHPVARCASKVSSMKTQNVPLDDFGSPNATDTLEEPSPTSTQLSNKVRSPHDVNSEISSRDNGMLNTCSNRRHLPISRLFKLSIGQALVQPPRTTIPISERKSPTSSCTNLVEQSIFQSGSKREEGIITLPQNQFSTEVESQKSFGKRMPAILSTQEETSKSINVADAMTSKTIWPCLKEKLRSLSPGREKPVVLNQAKTSDQNKMKPRKAKAKKNKRSPDKSIVTTGNEDLLGQDEKVHSAQRMQERKITKPDTRVCSQPDMHVKNIAKKSDHTYDTKVSCGGPWLGSNAVDSPPHDTNPLPSRRGVLGLFGDNDKQISWASSSNQSSSKQLNKTSHSPVEQPITVHQTEGGHRSDRQPWTSDNSTQHHNFESQCDTSDSTNTVFSKVDFSTSPEPQYNVKNPSFHQVDTSRNNGHEIVNEDRPTKMNNSVEQNKHSSFKKKGCSSKAMNCGNDHQSPKLFNQSNDRRGRHYVQRGEPPTGSSSNRDVGCGTNVEKRDPIVPKEHGSEPHGNMAFGIGRKASTRGMTQKPTTNNLKSHPAHKGAFIMRDENYSIPCTENWGSDSDLCSTSTPVVNVSAIDPSAEKIVHSPSDVYDNSTNSEKLSLASTNNQSSSKQWDQAPLSSLRQLIPVHHTEANHRSGGETWTSGKNTRDANYESQSHISDSTKSSSCKENFSASLERQNIVQNSSLDKVPTNSNSSQRIVNKHNPTDDTKLVEQNIQSSFGQKGFSSQALNCENDHQSHNPSRCGMSKKTRYNVRRHSPANSSNRQTHDCTNFGANDTSVPKEHGSRPHRNRANGFGRKASQRGKSQKQTANTLKSHPAHKGVPPLMGNSSFSIPCTENWSSDSDLCNSATPVKTSATNPSAEKIVRGPSEMETNGTSSQKMVDKDISTRKSNSFQEANQSYSQKNDFSSRSTQHKTTPPYNKSSTVICDKIGVERGIPAKSSNERESPCNDFHTLVLDKCAVMKDSDSSQRLRSGTHENTVSKSNRRPSGETCVLGRTSHFSKSNESVTNYQNPHVLPREVLFRNSNESNSIHCIENWDRSPDARISSTLPGPPIKARSSDPTDGAGRTWQRTEPCSTHSAFDVLVHSPEQKVVRRLKAPHLDSGYAPLQDRASCDSPRNVSNEEQRVGSVCPSSQSYLKEDHMGHEEHCVIQRGDDVQVCGAWSEHRSPTQNPAGCGDGPWQYSRAPFSSRPPKGQRGCSKQGRRGRRHVNIGVDQRVWNEYNPQRYSDQNSNQLEEDEHRGLRHEGSNQHGYNDNSHAYSEHQHSERTNQRDNEDIQHLHGGNKHCGDFQHHPNDGDNERHHRNNQRGYSEHDKQYENGHQLWSHEESEVSHKGSQKCDRDTEPLQEYNEQPHRGIQCETPPSRRSSNQHNSDTTNRRERRESQQNVDFVALALNTPPPPPPWRTPGWSGTSCSPRRESGHFVQQREEQTTSLAQLHNYQIGGYSDSLEEQKQHDIRGYLSVCAGSGEEVARDDMADMNRGWHTKQESHVMYMPPGDVAVCPTSKNYLPPPTPTEHVRTDVLQPSRRLFAERKSLGNNNCTDYVPVSTSQEHNGSPLQTPIMPQILSSQEHIGPPMKKPIMPQILMDERRATTETMNRMDYSGNNFDRQQALQDGQCKVIPRMVDSRFIQNRFEEMDSSAYSSSQAPSMTSQYRPPFMPSEEINKPTELTEKHKMDTRHYVPPLMGDIRFISNCSKKMENNPYNTPPGPQMMASDQRQLTDQGHYMPPPIGDCRVYRNQPEEMRKSPWEPPPADSMLTDDRSSEPQCIPSDESNRIKVPREVPPTDKCHKGKECFDELQVYGQADNQGTAVHSATVDSTYRITQDLSNTTESLLQPTLTHPSEVSHQSTLDCCDHELDQESTENISEIKATALELVHCSPTAQPQLRSSSSTQRHSNVMSGEAINCSTLQNKVKDCLPTLQSALMSSSSSAQEVCKNSTGQQQVCSERSLDASEDGEEEMEVRPSISDDTCKDSRVVLLKNNSLQQNFGKVKPSVPDIMCKGSRVPVVALKVKTTQQNFRNVIAARNALQEEKQQQHLACLSLVKSLTNKGKKTHSEVTLETAVKDIDGSKENLSIIKFKKPLRGMKPIGLRSRTGTDREPTSSPLTSKNEEANAEEKGSSNDEEVEYDWFDNLPPDGKDIIIPKRPTPPKIGASLQSGIPPVLLKSRRSLDSQKKVGIGVGYLMKNLGKCTEPPATSTTTKPNTPTLTSRIGSNSSPILWSYDSPFTESPSTTDSDTSPKRPLRSHLRRNTRWSDPPPPSYTRYKNYDGNTDYDPSWKKKFKACFENLKTLYIDTHCHIDFLMDRSKFIGSFPQYRCNHEETFPATYAGCVAVFCDPHTFQIDGKWKDMLQDDGVVGAIGCHPKKAIYFDALAKVNLKEMLQHPKVVALGEIGLDYSNTFGQHKDIQQKVFREQIQMALDANLPLVIHCRDAEDDCLKILSELVPRNHRIHRHCFTGTWMEAQVWLRQFPSSFIGLTPLITNPGGRGYAPREVAREMPLDRLLLETDAPYFVPRMVPRGAMLWSHPGMAVTVAAEVAALRMISIEEVLSNCLQNTETMYGIKPDNGGLSKVTTELTASTKLKTKYR